jgi:pentatricopeptide repeat protein
MHIDFFTPTIEIFKNCLGILSYCPPAEVAELVQHFYATMQQHGVQPDADVYATLIRFATRRADLDEAGQLFGEMMKKGLSPTLEVFEVILPLLEQQKDFKSFLKMVHSMKTNNIKPTTRLLSLVESVLQQVNKQSKASRTQTAATTTQQRAKTTIRRKETALSRVISQMESYSVPNKQSSMTI